MPEQPTTMHDGPADPAAPRPQALPPHRAEPTFAGVEPDDFAAYLRFGENAFFEDPPAEHLALEQAVSDPARFFGAVVGGRRVSTFGSFTRRLTVPGGASMPVSAVTLVTVHPAYRRRGLLTSAMAREFDRCAERGEAIAALYASESGIYGRFGYGNAASELKLSGATRSLALRPEVAEQLAAAGGSVDEVSREDYLAVVPALHERLTARRPGSLDRPADWWNLTLSDPPATRRGATAVRYLVSYAADGRIDGHARYSVNPGESTDGNPAATIRIREAEGDGPAATARLWTYLASVDLVRTFTADRAPLDHALQYLVADARAIVTRRQDALYLRVLDVPRALAARSYAAAIDVVVEVEDRFRPEAGGRFALTGDGSGAQVSRTTRAPHLTIAARDLAAAYLGETSLAALAAAGLVREHQAGSVAAAAAAFFSPIAPFCADTF